MTRAPRKTRGPHYSGRSSPESARTSKTGSLRLRPETWAELDAQAAAAGLSRSAYVARLVEERVLSPRA